MSPRGRVWPRLHILDLASGEIRRIADAVPPRKRELSGTTPLIWTEHGLFASAQSRILRCDPEGDGCRVVHTFEDYQIVRGGTHVGGGRAYVLITDIRPDVFEIRANELHEVDLVRGGGKLLLRLPDGVFLDDIDWIAD